MKWLNLICLFLLIVVLCVGCSNIKEIPAPPGPPQPPPPGVKYIYPEESSTPSEPITFTLSISVNPVGVGYVSPSSGEYQQGSTLTLNATPSDNYTFTHWSGNVDTMGNVKAASTIVTMDGDYNITANFEVTEPSSKNWLTQPPQSLPDIEVIPHSRSLISLENEPSFDAENPRYIIYEDGTIEVGGDNEPIELINNPEATNPTYAELVAFIKEDSTDEHTYIDRNTLTDVPYVCSDFAEDVHNNAEAAGIRAAWVGVDFYDDTTEGHALNAFETTDKGLVYIDCTEIDAVAYVKITEDYCCIEIDKATSLDYSFYKTYEWRYKAVDEALSAYNEEVPSFNQRVEEYEDMVANYDERVAKFNAECEYYSKILEIWGEHSDNEYVRRLKELHLQLMTGAEDIGEYLKEKEAAFKATEKELKESESVLKSKEWELKTWEDKLDTKRYEISNMEESFNTGDCWLEPMGIVKGIHVHWGKE